jgi:hypothetical protein
MASGMGSTTIDFGDAPGTNVITKTVSSLTGLTSSGYAEAWIRVAATADFNAYEHSTILAQHVRFAATPGTDSMVITATSDLRLNGLVSVNYVWST